METETTISPPEENQNAVEKFEKENKILRLIKEKFPAVEARKIYAPILGIGYSCAYLSLG